MTVHRFFIPERLPGLNEIINTARAHHMASATQKKRWTNRCALVFMKAPTFESIYIKFTWIEKNRRRDKDNICAARKFILDGMVQAGMIENDGWGQISGWTDDFEVSEKIGVLVDIYDSKAIEIAKECGLVCSK